MAKKDFSNNPAFQLLGNYTERENKASEIQASKAQTSEPANTEEKPKRQSSRSTASNKRSGSITVEIKETKTKRTTLLLKASIYSKIEAYAKKNKLSFNDLVNQILEQVEL